MWLRQERRTEAGGLRSEPSSSGTEKLIGRVQERYGYARQDAKREVDSFLDRRFP